MPEVDRTAIEAPWPRRLRRVRLWPWSIPTKGSPTAVPSDVIIDASMPAMIREGGKMWNDQGETQDAVAIIPDRSYAGVYQATIDFCKRHGALDPAVMGTVPNVGLMAQKAEEYGLRQNLPDCPCRHGGRTDATGQVLMSQSVQAGDVFRMCQVKDAPIQDWVKPGVPCTCHRRFCGVLVDANRAHDAQLIAKVEAYLPHHDTDGLDLRVRRLPTPPNSPLSASHEAKTPFPSQAMCCGTTSPICFHPRSRDFSQNVEHRAPDEWRRVV